MKITKNIILCLSILLVGGICYGDNWPQFRGPNRDGKSTETGLMKKWPEGGPKILWSIEGLGIGFSSVAISRGFVYTTGMIDGEGFLFAYDIEGNLKWKESYGPEWTRSYKGTRTTPTVDGERVYVFSGTGNMVCFKSRTREKVWQIDTLTKFEGKNIQWGMSGSPLIDGRKVYCTPGGKKGTMVLTRDGHSCGSLSGSPGFLFGRGSTPRLYDLTEGGKSRNFCAITRPGCWINCLSASIKTGEC